jgi:hypothetical protein
MFCCVFGWVLREKIRMDEIYQCIYNGKRGYYVGRPPKQWEKREDTVVLTTEFNKNYNIMQSFLKLEDLAKRLNKDKTKPVQENVKEFIVETDGKRFFNKMMFQENGTLVNLMESDKNGKM